MKLTLVATCLFGLERLLGREIEELGYERVNTIDGRVTFLGDCEAVALSNVFLRYAERVYIKVGSFHAETFDELFEGTRALPFEDFIGRDDMFPVKGHAIKSRLFSVPDCQSIIKKAIVTRLSGRYGLSVFPETGTKYQIEFFILKDEATLMIDTSGTPLHKRGYRTEANLAPIRETLAAAIAAQSRPREEVLFWDPFCGSGTIGIEAAMQMRHIAPGKNRRFAAENFAFMPKNAFPDAREEAVAGETPSDFTVFLSDIDRPSLEIAKANAARAGVADALKIFYADARNIHAEGRRATIVTNPPYGERMGQTDEIERLYRDIGVHFRSLSPWQVYIITSCAHFESLYGRRADGVLKLYNGMLPCYLYEYFKNPLKTPFPADKQKKKDFTR